MAEETETTGEVEDFDATQGQPCDVDGCDKAARFTYTWDWGQTGVCCEQHQVEFGQKSQTLKRNCQFVALNPGAEAPLERTERAQLKGECYALEMEITDYKNRNASLYEQNRQLAGQVQALTVREAESGAQLRDMRATVEKETKAADTYRRRNAEMVDELTRLRLLVSTEDTQPGAGSRLGPGELPPGTLPPE